ncbi:ubiquitin carboxyl-terminal hydrolase 47-like isoform X2 [Hypanus sabinus]|uniref:ubiquitin carboxyl-terminal hydrolase 47-like isoform X2 n=1 Tax=Hypanus sabinus TaxID=79690 RepID=UPI0028C44DD8|nr:ubiquitin carboxyl-terminal hydrolase 47-like isoform X2 [Hypanus sabinus]
MFKKSGKKSTKQKTTKETSDPNKKCSEEFTGIQNKGATCYLNALLQTLYMSNEVKDAVIRLKNRTKANKKAKQMSIAYQLAVLFEELENKRTGNTNKITEVLGINVTKQQDVAEHFQQILNKLAEDRNSHNILQIYQSKLINFLTCSECKTEFLEKCQLLVIPLPVHLNDCGNSIQSVNAALQDFFKTVILDGDNLCYCDTCQKKTKATMRYRCEILPQILVLQLKRFEFDYSMKSFKKLHNKVEIPQRLKFQKNEKVGEPEWIPYSTSEESSKALRKQQSSSGAESGKRSKSKEVEEKQNLQLDGSQRIFTTYKLFATCDHKGEFGFGHYVAHIRPDTSNKWYNFNDTYVSEVENFFPEVRQNNTESMPCRRSSEAYLLMYRKENMNSNQDVTNAEEGAERIKAQRLHDGKSNYQTETNDRRKMAECEKTEENQMEDLPRKRHKNSIFSCFSGLNDESEIN